MIIVVKDFAVPTWNQIIHKTARHWAAKAKVFEEAKEAVGWAIYQADKPKLPFKNKVSISFVAEYKDRRLRDVDGLSLKAVLDSLVDNDVLVDDNVKYVDEISLKLIIGTENKLTITINEQN